ncbi:MAG: class I SAM-dependent methyltransferase [Gemmatimonadota bacterium]|nr:class I SAM-dependent methyltransferase [Gemmatimonadota bacterium]
MSERRGEDRERGGNVYADPSVAEAYDDDRYGGPFGRALEAREARLHLRLAAPALDGGPVLDAGTGTGKLYLRLAGEGRTAVGTDRSLPMLRRAAEGARRAGVAPRFAVANLVRLGFPDRAFRCTLCSRVLMHLEDWRAAMAELCRVTDRLLVVDAPRRSSFAGLESLVRRVIPWGRRDRPAYRTFSVADLRGELERHGFEVTAIESGHFLPVALHRRIARPELSRSLEAPFERLGLTGRFGSPVTLRAERRSGREPR